MSYGREINTISKYQVSSRFFKITLAVYAVVDNLHKCRPKTVTVKTLYTTVIDAKQCQCQ